jgi:hypothetical protein
MRHRQSLISTVAACVLVGLVQPSHARKPGAGDGQLVIVPPEPGDTSGWTSPPTSAEIIIDPPPVDSMPSVEPPPPQTPRDQLRAQALANREARDAHQRQAAEIVAASATGEAVMSMAEFELTMTVEEVAEVFDCEVGTAPWQRAADVFICAAPCASDSDCGQNEWCRVLDPFSDVTGGIVFADEVVRDVDGWLVRNDTGDAFSDGAELLCDPYADGAAP